MASLEGSRGDVETIAPTSVFWSGWCAVGRRGGNTYIYQARIGFVAGKLRPIILSRLQNKNSGLGQSTSPLKQSWITLESRADSC